MTEKLILASASEARSRLLSNACVEHRSISTNIDEDSIKLDLLAKGATTSEVADTLAEMKARKVNQSNHGALVLGCDQALDFNGNIISKPRDVAEVRQQLLMLRGQTHRLLSAAVLYKDQKPIWRYVGVVSITLRDVTNVYLDDYIARNWESIRWSVGGYKVEEEGIRLFSNIEGDIFTIQGLPMIQLLSYLTLRGTLPS